jgi:hypothetical protein
VQFWEGWLGCFFVFSRVVLKCCNTGSPGWESTVLYLLCTNYGFNVCSLVFSGGCVIIIRRRGLELVYFIIGVSGNHSS